MKNLDHARKWKGCDKGGHLLSKYVLTGSGVDQPLRRLPRVHKPLCTHSTSHKSTKPNTRVVRERARANGTQKLKRPANEPDNSTTGQSRECSIGNCCNRTEVEV